MSRQQDVIKVFDFLIELLKEKETISEPKTSTPKPTETKVDEPNDLTNEFVLGVPASDIRDMMQKISDIEARKPQFDEPLLRKAIPEELRDTDEESKSTIHLKSQLVFDPKTLKPSMEFSNEIVKV